MADGPVKDVMVALDAALAAKDVDAVMACYAPNSVTIDITSTCSNDGLRQAWTSCFPYFPNGAIIRRRNLTVFPVGPDAAALAYEIRCEGMGGVEAWEDVWMRGTTVIAPVDGKCRIVHDHCSFEVIMGATGGTIRMGPTSSSESTPCASKE